MAKTVIDLMREYVRVSDMCDAYNKEYSDAIKPWACMRYNDASLRNHGDHPHLNGVPDGYEFAVAIVGGEPVFVGDNVYDSRGILVTVIGSFNDAIICKYNKENERSINPKHLALSPHEHKRTARRIVEEGE